MSEARTITMKDGRTLSFGEKQKMSKDYGVTDAGRVYCQIDFDNGETVRLEIDPAFPRRTHHTATIIAACAVCLPEQGFNLKESPYGQT